jgi:hypothetical protein
MAKLRDEGRRRQLGELISLYRREPSVRDVFVEGPTDKWFVECFIRATGMTNANVYEIDVVDMRTQDGACTRPDDGNRGRLVLLAHHIAEVIPGSQQATCIVDRDFDDFLDIPNDCPVLLLTDFSCIEMYLFSDEAVGRFLRSVCRLIDCPVDELLKSYACVLQALFLVRLANRRLGWCLERPQKPLSTWCACTGHELRFDIENYIDRYLAKNKRSSSKREFIAAVDESKKELGSDVRRQMNGHDFAELLVFCARSHGNSLFRSSKADCEVFYLLAMAFDFGALTSYTLFSSLLSRFS